jgi:sugar phosphate isomerase/epimerase
MEIGIMARTFVRPTLTETLDAIRAHGIESVQFGLECAGLPPMPDRLDPGDCDRIRRELAARGVRMAAVSGTFNMIHPDPAERRRGLQRLRELASACDRLGTSIITLCTGTRDPVSMWRRHPENDSPEAWEDLLASMREATQIAEESGVTLAVEPEVSNVVDSARKARALLDALASTHVKIVIDGANLFHTGELPRMREILDEAFTLLGPDIVLAHAKDLSRDGEAGHEAAGTGLLDYDQYVALLGAVGYEGPLVLHSLQEAQVAGCVAFLRGKMGAQSGGGESGSMTSRP